MESNRKLSCMMISLKRLHGSLSFCRARYELFKNSFFLKQLIIHRLHDKQRLSFDSPLAIRDQCPIILSFPHSKFEFVSRAKELRKGS